MTPILDRLRRKFSFAAGLRSGMISFIDIYSGNDFRLHQRSAVEEMRSDWERIGGDFRAVMGREYERIAAEQEGAGSGGDGR